MSTSFSVAFAGLNLLRCASTLHGGVTQDPNPGEGFLIPGFLLTKIVIKKLYEETKVRRSMSSSP